MQKSRAPERTAKIVAALLSAISPVAGAFPAAAQQVALGADFSSCEQIEDPAKSAQCVYDKDIAHSKARIAAADVRIATAQDSIACAKFLLSKKAAGATLDPTRLNREKGCTYAVELGMK
jgi:hypothetical protein